MSNFFTGKFIIMMITLSLTGSILPLLACTKSETVNPVSGNVTEKASTLLISQVNLREAQIAKPTPERLELMRNMGMKADNLEIQQVFIYMAAAPNAAQIAELKSIGLTLYLDSWIPPVGTHPTGFLIADMPVDKLNELAKKAYVIKLDTAERQLQPQNSIGPQ